MGAIKELARLGTANAADALAQSTGAGGILAFSALAGDWKRRSRGMGEELRSRSHLPETSCLRNRRTKAITSSWWE